MFLEGGVARVPGQAGSVSLSVAPAAAPLVSVKGWGKVRGVLSGLSIAVLPGSELGHLFADADQLTR
jgi:hypothetical protein